MDEHYNTLLKQMESVLFIAPIPTKKLSPNHHLQKAKEWQHAWVGRTLVPVHQSDKDIMDAMYFH